MSRQTSTNRGGEDERLTMVPEEPPDASAACEKGALDESETSQPAAGPSEEASASGRPLERAVGSVRRALSEGAAEEREAKRRSFVPLVLGGRSIDVMLAEQDTCIHPLLRAAMQAQDDLMNHYHHEGDHGSWNGRWSTPSRIEWEIFELAKWPWPRGEAPREALLATQTGTGNHKELRWSQMDEETRQQFRIAAGERWEKWIENGAVEVLPLHQSRTILQELERKGELDRVLQPRFVLTDKNASLRTPECDLPLKASARIVVPAYRDLANLQNELRRDAPTGSRLAQHILFSIAGAHPDWFLRSADVRAAFLKGDPYVQRVLYMSGTDGAKGPSIPISKVAIARVLKGVGLADAPREWWLRLDRELRDSGWTRSMLDGALWYLRKPDPQDESREKLIGVIVRQ